jgi:hypothetical protein
MRINMSRSLFSTIRDNDSNQPSLIRGRILSIIISIAAVGMVLCLSTSVNAQRFQQTNLVSDIPGMAAVTDSNLMNPWGLARSSTSPWWVADNGTGLSTLYTGTGAIVPLVVTIPVPPGGEPPSTPTGTVFNGNSLDFLGDRFLFVTEDGTIAGWSGGTMATIRVNNSGSAIYKGLALSQINGVSVIYAANFLELRSKCMTERTRSSRYRRVRLRTHFFEADSLHSMCKP